MRTASALWGRGGHHGKNVAAAPQTPRRDFLFPLPPKRPTVMPGAAYSTRRNRRLTGLGEV